MLLLKTRVKVMEISHMISCYWVTVSRDLCLHISEIYCCKVECHSALVWAPDPIERINFAGIEDAKAYLSLLRFVQLSE